MSAFRFSETRLHRFFGFLEDDEFVADEIPGESGNTSDRRADESPLVGGKSSYLMEEGEDERRSTDIDDEADEADQEELGEFGGGLLAVFRSESPVLVPEVAVDIRDDEGDALVEDEKGNRGEEGEEDVAGCDGGAGQGGEGEHECESAEVDQGVQYSDDDEFGELPDDGKLSADPGSDYETDRHQGGENGKDDEFQ